MADTVKGGGVRAEFGEALPLIEHLYRQAVKSLGDELDAQSTTAVSERQRLGHSADGVEHATSVDGVERRDVGQMRRQQLEHLHHETQPPRRLLLADEQY